MLRALVFVFLKTVLPVGLLEHMDLPRTRESWTHIGRSCFLLLKAVLPLNFFKNRVLASSFRLGKRSFDSYAGQGNIRSRTLALMRFHFGSNHSGPSNDYAWKFLPSMAPDHSDQVVRGVFCQVCQTQRTGKTQSSVNTGFLFFQSSAPAGAESSL